MEKFRQDCKDVRVFLYYTDTQNSKLAGEGMSWLGN
ncbi:MULTISPECIES: hypothetical protein [Metallosphaera]|nr:hypothetical protein [Metallosphaera sedula]MCH1772191.1 hypothetical protein [Metallosphaera sedula]MCP6727737.1 hypothetical protein [Metallosphaera sedula]